MDGNIRLGIAHYIAVLTRALGHLYMFRLYVQFPKRCELRFHKHLMRRSVTIDTHHAYIATSEFGTIEIQNLLLGVVYI